VQAEVEIIALTKTFPGRGRAVRRALDVPRFEVWPGEMVALIGASGSGKSTLLRHIAGLTLGDRGAGCITVHGQVMQRNGRTPRGVRRVRAGIGVVFQQFNLVGRLPVLTNVLVGALARLPLWRTLPGWFPAVERDRAMQALARVGIAEQAHQRAGTLSGGQQQRAAIARTLVQGARLILADEPIASLDPESSRNVMETLAELNRVDGITVVVSLHQVDFAVRFCRRVVALRHGRILYDGPSEGLSAEMLAEVYGSEMPVPTLQQQSGAALVPA
jgi:phosphonate transport system ATP-binding protein